MNQRLFRVLVAGWVVGQGSALYAADFFGPSPYLSVADSPFASVPGLTVVTFESGGLPAGVSASTGQIAVPGLFTDSVDADDGTIDGLGSAGHSFYIQTQTVRFDFVALTGSTLPTHVGVVWTDVGTVPGAPLGFAPVTFVAFGPDGIELEDLPGGTLGDGTAASSTAEDRFFGVFNAAGVSAITLTTVGSIDWELDHLQFGGVVPEPTTVGVLAAAGILGLRRPRR
jgi:hypothetical protein